MFYLSKLVEYCDTLFFILRKKFHNVNFVHVYHHASANVYIWGVATFVPTGTAFVPCFCNAVVHVAIYSYYLLSSLGPKYTKYLWWRNYLSLLQILQERISLFDFFLFSPTIEYFEIYFLKKVQTSLIKSKTFCRNRKLTSIRIVFCLHETFCTRFDYNTFKIEGLWFVFIFLLYFSLIFQKMAVGEITQ